MKNNKKYYLKEKLANYAQLNIKIIIIVNERKRKSNDLLRIFIFIR